MKARMDGWPLTPEFLVHWDQVGIFSMIPGNAEASGEETGV